MHRAATIANTAQAIALIQNKVGMPIRSASSPPTPPVIAAPTLTTQPYRHASTFARAAGSGTSSAIAALSTGRGASYTRPARAAPTINAGSVCAPAISISTVAASTMVATSVNRRP